MLSTFSATKLAVFLGSILLTLFYGRSFSGRTSPGIPAMGRR
jgi:hypothetical protein